MTVLVKPTWWVQRKIPTYKGDTKCILNLGEMYPAPDSTFEEEDEESLVNYDPLFRKYGGKSNFRTK